MLGFLAVFLSPLWPLINALNTPVYLWDEADIFIVAFYALLFTVELWYCIHIYRRLKKRNFRPIRERPWLKMWLKGVRPTGRWWAAGERRTNAIGLTLTWGFILTFACYMMWVTMSENAWQDAEFARLGIHMHNYTWPLEFITINIARGWAVADILAAIIFFRTSDWNTLYKRLLEFAEQRIESSQLKPDRVQRLATLLVLKDWAAAQDIESVSCLDNPSRAVWSPDTEYNIAGTETGGGTKKKGKQPQQKAIHKTGIDSNQILLWWRWLEGIHAFELKKKTRFKFDEEMPPLPRWEDIQARIPEIEAVAKQLWAYGNGRPIIRSIRQSWKTSIATSRFSGRSFARRRYVRGCLSNQAYVLFDSELEYFLWYDATLDIWIRDHPDARCTGDLAGFPASDMICRIAGDQVIETKDPFWLAPYRPPENPGFQPGQEREYLSQIARLRMASEGSPGSSETVALCNRILKEYCEKKELILTYPKRKRDYDTDYWKAQRLPKKVKRVMVVRPPGA